MGDFTTDLLGLVYFPISTFVWASMKALIVDWCIQNNKTTTSRWVKWYQSASKHSGVTTGFLIAEM